MKLIHLPKKIRSKGMIKEYCATQITANNAAFIYKVTSEEGFERYEVFKIIHDKVMETQGTYRMRYPSGKDLGKWLWSYTRISDAKKKFNYLSRSSQA